MLVAVLVDPVNCSRPYLHGCLSSLIDNALRELMFDHARLHGEGLAMLPPWQFCLVKFWETEVRQGCAGTLDTYSLVLKLWYCCELDIFNWITKESLHLAYYNKTITSYELQTTALLLLSGELAKHVVPDRATKVYGVHQWQTNLYSYTCVGNLYNNCLRKRYTGIFKPGACWPQACTHLVSWNCFGLHVGMCVCLCVCPWRH